MDALKQFSHRTLTENYAPAYDSTRSATLDAFHKLTHFSWSPGVGPLLEKAWAEDPDMTLKIIWNLRSIHDGKAEKEGFYRAFGGCTIIPRTAITHLHVLSEEDPGRAHGYWKDLLNIMLSPLLMSEQHCQALPLSARPPRAQGSKNHKRRDTAQRAAVGVANHARIERKLANPKYRALYIAVARLFAQRLLTDWRFLKLPMGPSLLDTHDRHTNIATAISRLFTMERTPSRPSASPTDILCSFYRRWLLTPLRDAAVVTERFMAANRWTEIPYNRVSAACMKNNNERFFTRDPDGFQKYLISVEKESARWRAIDNSIAICDVSGSMGSSTVITPSQSPHLPGHLALVAARSARQAAVQRRFHHLLAQPRVRTSRPRASLHTTVETMSRASWQMNTDLRAVFLRLLLPLAIENKVRPEDMIKRVFVPPPPSSLYGARGPWETTHSAIERTFTAAGYEVPQIVYWNLSQFETVEVMAEQKGVALMSGFSPSMLKIFR
ncbi:hypothetical protein B0H14DRAFT_3095332 [Mycena olivaceomarginata]|nr:hypothetical protein B0H14DRAFT_3095332 [Mycena olivaceomarginata]